MDEDCCEICKFYREEDHYNGGLIYSGFCRAHPIFVSTNELEWCGEFKPRFVRKIGE